MDTRTEAVIAADTDDDIHELYRLGQQHATEDVVAFLRHEATLSGGNPKLRSLAVRIEAGEHTKRGGRRRRAAVEAVAMVGAIPQET